MAKLQMRAGAVADLFVEKSHERWISPMNLSKCCIGLSRAAATVSCLVPLWAGAVTLDIAVYQVCISSGSACASTGPVGNAYYAAETNKIWAQAGIAFTFSFQQQIFSDAFYDVNDEVVGDGFDDLYESVFGAGTASSNTTRIDMFLVDDYAGAFGAGYSGFGGLIMSMKAISEFDCGGAAGCTGRIDTLAHEIGHNFGLVPTSFADYAGSADPGHSNNINALMAGGGSRNVPTTMADIAPDGLGLDLLPQTHIDFALQSSLVTAVPEPASAVTLALGLLGLGAWRRRRMT